MVLIEWRKEFETGDAAVDYEHQELVNLLNEVIETIKDGERSNDALDSLGEVNARISGHFALEEVEMRRCEYEQYNEHKEDHERLLDEIRDIMDDFENGSFNGDVEAFSIRLRDWFVDHFKNQDARLHRVLSSH